MSGRDGGFDESYQLLIQVALPVGLLGLAFGSGGVHGGVSGDSPIAADSSGGHGEEAKRSTEKHTSHFEIESLRPFTFVRKMRTFFFLFFFLHIFK